jgi:hypothetical protein
MRAKTRKLRGGFYPSVMTGLMRAGPYFITSAVMAGRLLLENDRARMAARGRTRQSIPGRQSLRRRNSTPARKRSSRTRRSKRAAGSRS